MLNAQNFFKGLIDQHQAAEILDEPVEIIIKLINDNQLPARRIEEKYFIKNSDLKNMLKKANVGISNKEENK